MRVVQAALRQVDDDARIRDQELLYLPLLGLAEAYNTLASGREDFFELTEQSTGREVKIAIAGLKLREKISLLHQFAEMTASKRRAKARVDDKQEHANIRADGVLAAPGRLTTKSTQAERLADMEQEERIKFRGLAKRVLLFMLAPIPPLLAGAVVAMAWSKGHMDTPLVNGFMNTVLEMVKLILTT